MYTIFAGSIGLPVPGLGRRLFMPGLHRKEWDVRHGANMSYTWYTLFRARTVIDDTTV